MTAACGRRSPAAQLRAMESQWPEFSGRKAADGTLIWIGPLRPKAKLYIVLVIWNPATQSLPYVFVREPKLQPRAGGDFEQIPHLIFDSTSPEESALCLFDPDGREWTPSDLIADTTIRWASEWLLYYELWHLFGEWLGSGIGYESVAEQRLEEARSSRAVAGDVH